MEDSAAPTHSRTSDWLARSAIPTPVPTSVVTGCKLCVSEFGRSALGPFWPCSTFSSCFSGVLQVVVRTRVTPPTHFIPTAFGTIPTVKPFRVRTRRNVFILSSNILALISLNWHTRLLPSHTLIVLCKTPPPHPPLLYLPFAFRSAVLHFAC